MSHLKVDPLTRRQRGNNTPAGGEWKTAPADGWRHGDIPEPPDGIMPESVSTWYSWFDSWPASFWELGDVPQLRAAIQAFDRVARGRPGGTALQHMLNSFGLTPAGQRNLRWLPPDGDEPGWEQEPTTKTPTPGARYPLPGRTGYVPDWSQGYPRYSGAQERMTGPGGPYEGLRITEKGHYRVRPRKEHPGKANDGSRDR